MAEAKMHNGVAIVAYRDGKALDSEGRVIPGAPAQPADTKPAAATAPVSSEEVLANAFAKALRSVVREDRDDRDVRVEEPRSGSGSTGDSKSAKEEEELEPEPLPTVGQLAEVLAEIMDPAQVKAMQARDERKTAAPLYEARLAELAAE